MTTTLLLRCAAVISAIFTAGHTAGGLQKWSPMGDNPVLRQMTDMHFQTMGVSRSYADFYFGFGWYISAAMVLQSVLLWQMASLARGSGAPLRPMIAAFLAANIAAAVIAWQFLFPLPALFSVVLLVLLLWAYAVAR